MGTRIKTFDATGVAPNGRLFAGDLNLLQDQYADLTNFAQTISSGVYRIGDSTIQLLKFGAAEARLSSALRTDGILRGLGGLYAGAFTTSQRDSIGAGFRPYGLVILNTTNNRYEWNIGTDASPIWTGLGGPVTIGTFAAMPAASSANAGNLYFATDANGGTWYVSNGTSWIRSTVGLSAITKGTLGARPAAASVPPGNVFVATDDHGGTSWQNDGTVWQKMGASIYGEVAIGEVLDWPWRINEIGASRLAPYGQAVSRATYSELNTIAAAAGYPWGAGDGTTTFNLPDYRGRIGVGLDNMGGVAANRITAAVSGIAGTTLGAFGGAEGITLSTAQIPAHVHADAGHDHPQNSLTVYWTGNALWTNGPNASVDATRRTGVGFAAIQNTGGGGAHANVQPSIMVNKVMRVL